MHALLLIQRSFCEPKKSCVAKTRASLFTPASQACRKAELGRRRRMQRYKTDAREILGARHAHPVVHLYIIHLYTKLILKSLLGNELQSHCSPARYKYIKPEYSAPHKSIQSFLTLHSKSHRARAHLAIHPKHLAELSSSAACTPDIHSHTCTDCNMLKQQTGIHSKKLKKKY